MALLALLFPIPVYAALGGDESSVLADQVKLKGSLRSTGMGAFTVHEIKSQAGSVIREYVSAGKVFAVSWHGSWPPDMHQLLGDHFQQYVDALRTRAAQNLGRRPLQIVQPDFVLQQSGHPRSFSGRAYLPQAMPLGVRAEAIQ